MKEPSNEYHSRLRLNTSNAEQVAALLATMQAAGVHVPPAPTKGRVRIVIDVVAEGTSPQPPHGAEEESA